MFLLPVAVLAAIAPFSHSEMVPAALRNATWYSVFALIVAFDAMLTVPEESPTVATIFVTPPVLLNRIS